MLKQEYETKTHIVTEKVLISEKRICDVCQKEITKDYWKVNKHHHDWGEDSWESYENFDVCSPECLKKMFDEYIHDSSTGYNTMAFDVEHTNH